MQANVGVSPGASGGWPVRMIVPGDADALIGFWRETWARTYGPSLGLRPLSRMLEGLDLGIAAMLPGTGERGYCTVLDNKLVGTAIVAERGRTAYLWGMYVAPERQRSGIGARLLAAVAESIQTSERLEVRVLSSSPWALAFYRKHGFRPIGEEMTEVMTEIQIATSVLGADVACLRK